MNNASASASLAAHSSVCDVCQGFGDLNNPRGYVLEGSYDKFFYTYVHHANNEAVIASAEAGCKLCELIRQGLERASYDGFDHSKDDVESSPTPDSAQPDSVVHVVQSDEDILTAPQIAELARRQGISSLAHLDDIGHGRVILQVYSGAECGPRDDNFQSHERIYVETTSGLRFHLSCFNSSGIFRSHEGMTELSIVC